MPTKIALRKVALALKWQWEGLLSANGLATVELAMQTDAFTENPSKR